MKLNVKINGLEKYIKQHPTRRDFSIVNVISMDQPSQRGEKFEAFVNRVNILHKKYGVKKLTVVLTDSLQKHYVGLNPKLANLDVKKLACKKGTDWLIQNNEFLSYLDLKINIEVWHWDKLVSRDDFKEALMQVEEFYKKEADFQEIVNRLSSEYAKKLSERRKNWKNPPDYTACFEAARNYLLEESAIWGPLLNLGFNFITYPGRKNEAVDYTYNKLSQSTHKYLPWLRYSFEKKCASLSLIHNTLIDHAKSIGNLSFSSFFSKVSSDCLPEDLELLELEKAYQYKRFSL